MSTVRFLGINPKALPQEVVIQPPVKLLACAMKHKIPIRFGCGACRCGTCAVSVTTQGPGSLNAIDPDEIHLLDQMSLALDGSIRLACKTKILAGDVEVDLGFQDTYDPDRRKE